MILGSLITYPQAIVLGLLQGVSELFPVSSLGHSVILPRLLGWNIHQNDKYFLTSVRSGKVRNGAVYMPPFEAVFSQEAMWAIKAYLETRREVK